MSYKEDINPIIIQNCFVCHSNNSSISPISLEGYNNLLFYAESGSLVGSIKHLSGYSPMPKGASKMTDCNIAKIEAWIAQGALDN
jgi:mono/diheme cytochrome c family protein